MIICIPSKGRHRTTTYQLFEASGFTVYHFIEPQEMHLYEVPNKVDIGATGNGMSWVRNFINRWARENGHQFICVCDDDITSFGTVQNKVAVKQPNAEALKKVFAFFEKGQFATGGINLRQFAWSESKKVKVNNGKMEMLHMLNLEKAKWDYCKGGKQDRDYLMQCFDNRQNHVFFAQTFLAAPAVGTNKGGCHDYYATGKDKEAVDYLCQRWGKYAKRIKQYGRHDVRLDYKQKAKDMGLKVI